MLQGQRTQRVYKSSQGTCNVQWFVLLKVKTDYSMVLL